MSKDVFSNLKRKLMLLILYKLGNVSFYIRMKGRREKKVFFAKTVFTFQHFYQFEIFVFGFYLYCHLNKNNTLFIKHRYCFRVPRRHNQSYRMQYRWPRNFSGGQCQFISLDLRDQLRHPVGNIRATITNWRSKTEYEIMLFTVNIDDSKLITKMYQVTHSLYQSKLMLRCGQRSNSRL